MNCHIRNLTVRNSFHFYSEWNKLKLFFFLAFQTLKREKDALNMCLFFSFLISHISRHTNWNISTVQKAAFDTHSAVAGRSAVGCVSFTKSIKRWQSGEEQCWCTTVLVCNLYNNIYIIACAMALCSLLLLFGPCFRAQTSAVMRNELWPPASWGQSQIIIKIN